MKSTILNDSFTMEAGISSSSALSRRQSQPLFKGVLYEEITDDFGKPLLKKIGENTVVLGGAITALYKLCGETADCEFIPDTIDNKDFNSDIEAGNTISHAPNPKDLTSRIALFAVGTGGHSVDGTGSNSDVWNAVAKKDIKKINVPGIIPMRRAAVLSGPLTSTGQPDTSSPDSPEHYFIKRPALDGNNQQVTLDGKPVYDYYMKEFAKPPVIRTHWKDSTDEEGLGTEVTMPVDHESNREEGLVSYAEFTLHFGENDVREYFVNTGQIANAHFNSIGLFSGNKVEQSDGTYAYENVRLFSYLNIDTKSVRIKTDATYRYRIFAIV